MLGLYTYTCTSAFSEGKSTLEIGKPELGSITSLSVCTYVLLFLRFIEIIFPLSFPPYEYE